MCNKIPENVFLDTSVVNFVLDYGEQIHDGMDVPDDTTTRVRRDIEALRNIWLTGQRANWHLTISPTTIAEVQQTREGQKHHRLMEWASELYIYSMECAATSRRDSRNESNISALSILPDANDRQLIQEAISRGCDAFCTRDWKTILRFRDSLREVPMSFISPHEWWLSIAPYAVVFA